MRRLFATLLLLTGLLSGCGRQTPPTDEELTQLFLENEAAFEEIRATVAEFPYGHEFPSPIHPALLWTMHRCLHELTHQDSLELNLQQPVAVRKRLRARLKQVGIGRVYFTGKEQAKKEQEQYGFLPQGGAVRFPCYSRGLLSGVAKTIVYADSLRGYDLVEAQELNELYRAYEPRPKFDPGLWVAKRIKGNWYICLEYTP